jgi:hypothetical protein
MSTNDDDLEIPEWTEQDCSTAERGKFWRWTRDGFDIGIDGATEYRLRLIPSNRVLATGLTARSVFAEYLREVEAGRSWRTLVVDWYGEDGQSGRLSGGLVLAELAQASVHGAKTLERNRRRRDT